MSDFKMNKKALKMLLHNIDSQDINIASVILILGSMENININKDKIDKVLNMLSEIDPKIKVRNNEISKRINVILSLIENFKTGE